MLLFSVIKLLFFLLCGQGGAVKGEHAILATKDKLYLAKLSESKRGNHWRQYDYQGGKPWDDELKNKTKTSEQEDKSNEKGRGDKKKVVKKKADKQKVDKKKTPFEIYGGDKAIPHQFPWIVRLIMRCQRHSNLITGGFCGGSLISPCVVVSAYHCSCNFQLPGQHVDYRALNFVVQLGAHNVNHKTYTTKQIIDVKYPPNPIHYNPNENNPDGHHDLALFVLNEPVKFSPKISLICLPSQDQNFDGRIATVAGWGITETGKLSPVLKILKLSVVGRAFSYNKTLAMSVEGRGHTTCLGDSGGPLMYKNTTSYTLIGTLSYGQFKCGVIGGGLFERVSDWVNWIKNEMDQLGENADGTKWKRLCWQADPMVGQGLGN